jgi:hypothetical protein
VGWESVAHFTQAFDKPEFRKNMVKVLPITVMSLQLFKKVAIAGVCLCGLAAVIFPIRITGRNVKQM